MNEIETLSICKLEEILDEIDENEKDSQQKHELDAFDYVAYLDDIDNKNTWFNSEKYKYIQSITISAASYNITLPEVIAEIIIISTILVPGCYSLAGLTFLNRTEYDLYSEYAQIETGYINNKSEDGISYKRKLPKINTQRYENTTASLWLDENGSICGFRCVWDYNLDGQPSMEQKFNVIDGCWTLNGEIFITFEYFDDLKDEFEGYVTSNHSNQCEIYGQWSNKDENHEMYGQFHWIINSMELFRFEHNPLYDTSDKHLLLYEKCFHIAITETIAISVQFIQQNNILGIYDKNEDDIVIGYGKWYKNGTLLFKNIKYASTESDILLSFNGYWNGEKIIGKLCMYHDMEAFNEYNQQVSFSQMIVSSNIAT
eukprot:401172_1